MTTAPLRVVVAGAQGPCDPAFRIRTVLPRDALAQLGIELEHCPLFAAQASAGRFATGNLATRTRVLLDARRDLRRRLRALAPAPVALIQRQVDMLPSRSLEREAMRGRRVVLDVDDAIWSDTLPAAGGHRLARLKDSERKVRWLAEAADVVIAGNRLLAERLADMNAAVTVVPSMVDMSDHPVREHEQCHELVLGWIGSGSTAAHLHGLSETLSVFAREVPQRRVQLLAVGARAPRPAGVVVDELPWSRAAERTALERMDVGLMPLPDNPWTRGKCAYKALQYMAAGVPVVTDDVGVSAEVVGERVGGLVVERREDWPAALCELADDSELRRRLGAAGRERVAADFSVRRWAPVLAQLIAGSK